MPERTSWDAATTTSKTDRGLPAARFSRKRNLVLVAVPVPPSLVNSDRATEFVIDALYKANSIAAGVFAKKGVEDFTRERADAIVDEVKDALGGQSIDAQCSE